MDEISKGSEVGISSLERGKGLLLGVPTGGFPCLRISGHLSTWGLTLVRSGSKKNVVSPQDGQRDH